MVEKERPEVWDILEEVIREKNSLLLQSRLQLQEKANELLQQRQALQEKEQALRESMRREAGLKGGLSAMERQLAQYASQQELLKKQLFKTNEAVQRIEDLDSLNSAQKVKKGKKLQLSQQELSSLFAAINACHHDFEKRLRAKYPSLTGTDVYLCCLLRMGVSNENIVVLLDTTENALKRRKYRIKHEKIAMPPQYESLDEFLRSF